MNAANEPCSKLGLTNEQKAVLGVIDGPVWRDDCEHGLDAYIASFNVIKSGPRLLEYDLYVFDEHGNQQVCIRYGDEPGDYISPGSLINFVKTACLHRVKLPEYWTAFDILQNVGSLTWKLDLAPRNYMQLSPDCIMVTERGVPVKDDYILKEGDSFLVVVKPKVKP